MALKFVVVVFLLFVVVVFFFLFVFLNTLLPQELHKKSRFLAGTGEMGVRLLPVYETLDETLDHCFSGFDSLSSACYVNNDMCDDPYRHVFFDLWHPMTWTHQNLALAALNTLGGDYD